MVSLLLVFLLSSICQVHSQGHFVPEATLEFLKPSGLRISLPDWNLAVRQVAFHVNINLEFRDVEHGQYAADITEKRSGRWTWAIPGVKVKRGDVVHYWINVIEPSQGYNALNRKYDVLQLNPHDGGGATPPTTATRPPCPTSQSSVNSRTSLCQGEVLLDKQFDNLDGWSHQVSIGGEYPDDEFTVFLKETYASWVDGGKLFIKPSLLEDRYNETFVRSGELVLPGCTSFVTEQCSRRGNSYVILPPIVSARLSTKHMFSFRYGTVEIRAKLPEGKWIVPELWLEPVNGPASERVVLGLSRGNADDSEFGWRTMEAGILGETQTSMGKKKRDTPWVKDTHTFKLHWTPDRMQFYVDDEEIHQVISDSYPIMDKEVYLTLGVHVAGRRDFSDNIPGKPWKNANPKRFLRFWDAKSSWLPSWNQNSVLQVESIKVTAV